MKLILIPGDRMSREIDKRPNALALN